MPHDDPGKVTYPSGELVYPSSADYVHNHYAMGGGVERYLSAFVGGISGKQSKFAYTANDLALKQAGTPVPVYSQVQTIFTDPVDGLTVKYIPVDHGPVPSVAFRIEYKGHTVVYSGDTGTKGFKPTGTVIDTDGDGKPDTIDPGFGAGNMTTIAQGADMLIYDAAIMECCDLPPNPLFHTLHTQPSLIAKVAMNANVGTLVLSHLTPITSPRVDEVKMIIRDNGYAGKIKEAKDLKVYNFGDDD